jgi:hypothetical protein
MKRPTTLVAALFFILCFSAHAQDQEYKFRTDPRQDINVPFRLFPTENAWTFLMLDTTDGRIWQVHYSVSAEAKAGFLALNNRSLLKEEDKPKIGRFTLYPTKNMYNFILLDQYDGRAWQCQWSWDKGKRGLLSLLDLVQADPSEEKKKE